MLYRRLTTFIDDINPEYDINYFDNPHEAEFLNLQVSTWADLLDNFIVPFVRFSTRWRNVIMENTDPVQRKRKAATESGVRQKLRPIDPTRDPLPSNTLPRFPEAEQDIQFESGDRDETSPATNQQLNDFAAQLATAFGLTVPALRALATQGQVIVLGDHRGSRFHADLIRQFLHENGSDEDLETFVKDNLLQTSLRLLPGTNFTIKTIRDLIRDNPQYGRPFLKQFCWAIHFELFDVAAHLAAINKHISGHFYQGYAQYVFRSLFAMFLPESRAVRSDRRLFEQIVSPMDEEFWEHILAFVRDNQEAYNSALTNQFSDTHFISNLLMMTGRITTMLEKPEELNGKYAIQRRYDQLIGRLHTVGGPVAKGFLAEDDRGEFSLASYFKKVSNDLYFLTYACFA